MQQYWPVDMQEYLPLSVARESMRRTTVVVVLQLDRQYLMTGEFFCLLQWLRVKAKILAEASKYRQHWVTERRHLYISLYIWMKVHI